MLLSIRVIPNAKKEKIKEENGAMRVYVTAPPEGGRANAAAIKILAKRFGAAKSSVRILKGEKSREKIIEIN